MQGAVQTDEIPVYVQQAPNTDSSEQLWILFVPSLLFPLELLEKTF